MKEVDSKVLRAVQRLLDISWIYHDCALDGTVYTFEELREAIDQRDAADPNMVSLYENIRNHYGAIEFTREQSKRKRQAITVDTIKKVHTLLNPSDDRAGYYRKENPVHKLYFHEIIPPERISYRLRKLVDFVNDRENQRSYHPIKFASKFHLRFMNVFPFSNNSGKVGRLLMNLYLMRQGYPPAIIHAVERQRYYEAIRGPHLGLGQILRDAIENANDSMLRVIESEGGTKGHRVAL